jgi:hypothetical protein
MTKEPVRRGRAGYVVLNALAMCSLGAAIYAAGTLIFGNVADAEWNRTVAIAILAFAFAVFMNLMSDYARWLNSGK